MAAKITRCLAYSLFRFVLPLALLIACLVRYSGLSLIYGILLLLTPLFRSPCIESLNGSTGHFLKAVLAISSIIFLSQSIFHIVLVSIATSNEPYGSVFGNCTENEGLVRQIGFQRLDDVPAKHIARLIGPDLLIFLVSIAILAICSKILKETPKESELTNIIHPQKHRVHKILQFSKITVLILLLAACSIIVPSLLSAFYFLTFLVALTFWAFGNSLGKRFSFFKFILLGYTSLHLTLLYLYQFPFFQEVLEEDSLVARLTGFTALVHTNCAAPWDIEFSSRQFSWPGFVNPGLLLLLYWVAAFQSRRWTYERSTVKMKTDVKSASAYVLAKRRVHHHSRRRHSGSERQVVLPATSDKGLVETGENMHYSSLDALPSSKCSVPKASDIEASEESEDDMRGSRMSHSRSVLSEKRSVIASVLIYVMNQSYVLTLIAMMAWSITFHSWLTFVLLLGACLIWMVPKSRRACLVVSPVIVIYAEVLLTIQFIYGLNLNDQELPNNINGINMAEVGFIKPHTPCGNMALQILYTLVFLLTLRQHMREKKLRTETPTEGYPLGRMDTGSTSITPAVSETLYSPIDSEFVDGYDGSTIKKIGRSLWSLLSKYWIFICAGMMLTIAIQDRVAYRLIYLIFFLYFVILFQLSYTIWRLTMYIFWWVVIIYSMAILCIIYTYQFSQFPEYWRNSTGLSKEMLEDLGLQQYDVQGLFEKLLTPTSFLIVIIIQVHYFHQPFMNLSCLERYLREMPKFEGIDMTAEEGHTTEGTNQTTATDTETETSKRLRPWRKELLIRCRVLWKRTNDTWNYVSQYLWRLMEIHIYKVVAFTIMIVAVKEVTAIGAVYVIIVALFLLLGKCRLLLSHILQIYTALVLLAKTSFQMTVARITDWEMNCTDNWSNSTNEMDYPFNETINNNIWIGLRKVDSNYLPNYLMKYVAILLIIAFQSIVRYHQYQHYRRPNHRKPAEGIIFSNITREDADKGIIDVLKYFANYFFFKFGLEICYITTAIAVSVRVDAYSIIYGIFLAALLVMSRRNNARVWPVYVLILTVLLPLQYMSSLGFPLALCTEYPWKDVLEPALQYWLFLPSYLYPPSAIILMADFFQLLFVCLQWYVFTVELRNASTSYGGGDNNDILPEVESSQEIPVPDFTTTMASYLDVAKYAVFYHLFWVTMAIVFFAGTNRINIFGFGYVIIVFCFMWFGQEFLLKPLRKLLWWWNFLIGYSFIVLLVKASLQLVGCVYMNGFENIHCWAVKLFGITCLNNFEKEQVARCEADKNGLGWDVVCFAFLLMQRRVYSSHYFRHIVAELEAQRRLASRGAELINRILIREVLLQKERETEVLFTIKKKMEHLKTKQAGLKKNFQEPDEHFQAIRSGDYYLFEDETEEVPERSDQGPTTSLNIGRPERSDSQDKTLGPLQLLSTAIDSGTDTALEKAREETDQSASQVQYSTVSDDKCVTIDMVSSVDRGEDEETTKPKESLCSKISNTFHLFIAILVSMANWLIKLFNRISRNYRRVAYTLTDDMRKEKLKIQAEKLTFLSLSTMEEGITTVDSKEAVARAAEDIGVNKIPVDVDTPQTSDIRKSFTTTNLQDIDEAEEENEFESAQPVFYRLLVAFYYMLISRSDLVCYFLIVLNQMMSASLLSMPLPIMVFLWGMLSVPRPSKTFWVTVITYTEAIVVLKYLFQFTFFPWNDDESSKNWQNNPFWPPRILGIEKQDYYAMYDLVLLLVLFIHRTILKRYGLWKDADDITADLEKAEVKELSPPSSPQTHEQRKFAATVAALEDQDYDLDAGHESEVDVPLKKMMIVSQDPKDNSPHITTLEPEPVEEVIQKRKLVSVIKPFKNFYRQMTNSAYNAVVDVYAPMFVCDFLAFLIVVFGYWAFGPVQSGEGSVTTYLEENRVPIPFLVMLVVQFMFIIIDRALFLRKCVRGKFIFQVSLVIIVHIWLFFILPAITNRMFIKNIPAMLWYFVKCIYFALSAHQIRSGYPTRILGNFLTKNYSYLNLFLFKGFLVIPFLLELRALMDWMWTDTTLALGSWLQMEDIYANIFVLKCWRHAEATYPTPRALKRKSTIKYGVGGLLLLLIIFIIWFPLVLFSFANTVYEVNPPKTCTIRISMGGYQPLFKMTAQQADISALTEIQYNRLHKYYEFEPKATSFLASYDPQDISIININGESTSVWGISPPSQKKLVRDLMASKHMDVDLDVSFTRGKRSPQSPGSFSKQFQMTLSNDTSKKLAQLISGGNSSQLVTISHLFYPFMRLQNNGIVSVIRSLVGEDEEPNIYLGFRSGNISQSSGRVDWWYVSEESNLKIWTPFPNSNASRLVLVTFNDRIAPATFSLITGYGIAGLYVSFILLIARFLRMGTINMHPSIMFRELPFVDRILKLTLDIYLVREMHEFRLEEDLYAKLIFLYRSPETLIKWTRRRIESKKDN